MALEIFLAFWELVEPNTVNSKVLLMLKQKETSSTMKWKDVIVKKADVIFVVFAFRWPQEKSSEIK